MKSGKRKRSTLLPFLRDADECHGPEYLTAPINTIKTGLELGKRVSVNWTKSTESILDVACCVERAHGWWYEPWCSTGRQKQSKERKEAKRHWDDFLAEAGWEFPRHAKLIRKLALIGSRAKVLIPNSANLPNSVETLALIADNRITNKQMTEIVAKLSPGSTTRNTLTVMKALAIEAGPKPTKNTAYSRPFTVKATLEEGNIIRLAAFLALSKHLGFDVPDSSAFDDLESQVITVAKTIEESPLFQDFTANIDDLAAKHGLKHLKRTKWHQQRPTSRFNSSGALGKISPTPPVKVA